MWSCIISIGIINGERTMISGRNSPEQLRAQGGMDERKMA